MPIEQFLQNKNIDSLPATVLILTSKNNNNSSLSISFFVCQLIITGDFWLDFFPTNGASGKTRFALKTILVFLQRCNSAVFQLISHCSAFMIQRNLSKQKHSRPNRILILSWKNIVSLPQLLISTQKTWKSDGVEKHERWLLESLLRKSNKFEIQLDTRWITNIPRTWRYRGESTYRSAMQRINCSALYLRLGNKHRVPPRPHKKRF